jgi:hypothetical protein
MGLLNLMNLDSEGIVPNSLRYIFQLKSTKPLKKKENAMKITISPFHSAKSTWMKSTICSTSSLRPNLLFAKTA